jgi:hypothetical protein
MSPAALRSTCDRPGPGGKWQISTEGGTEPVWNPKGRELFHRNGNKMMAVDVTTHGTFSAGKPKVLFEGALRADPKIIPRLRRVPGRPAPPDAQSY